MNEIITPPGYNYIACFLTLRCNLNCSYCINKYEDFQPQEEMNTEDWIKGLSRIYTRQDLPVTLQGGEPTIYPGFYKIANALHFQHKKHLDLLTNGMFNLKEFTQEIPCTVFKRGAKYASIRFSYHTKMSPVALAMKVWELQNRDYEVGIWGLDISQRNNKAMKNFCDCLNLDFRVKEYLSDEDGTYKYPEAHTGKFRRQVWCKGSELIIGPSGHIFRCHADLYSNRNWIGHILDDYVVFPEFEECENYGHCNPCDIKLKTNRLQEFGYCAVQIKGEEVKECQGSRSVQSV